MEAQGSGGSSAQVVFLWYGALTQGKNYLQTQHDFKSGKFSFKESALDKTRSSFRNSTVPGV